MSVRSRRAVSSSLWTKPENFGLSASYESALGVMKLRMRRSFDHPPAGMDPCTVKSKDAAKQAFSEHPADFVTYSSPGRPSGSGICPVSSRREKITAAGISRWGAPVPELWRAVASLWSLISSAAAARGIPTEAVRGLPAVFAAADTARHRHHFRPKSRVTWHQWREGEPGDVLVFEKLDGDFL